MNGHLKHLPRHRRPLDFVLYHQCCSERWDLFNGNRNIVVRSPQVTMFSSLIKRVVMIYVMMELIVAMIPDFQSKDDMDFRKNLQMHHAYI